jgi:hypothetical protein
LYPLPLPLAAHCGPFAQLTVLPQPSGCGPHAVAQGFMGTHAAHAPQSWTLPQSSEIIPHWPAVQGSLAVHPAQPDPSSLQNWPGGHVVQVRAPPQPSGASHVPEGTSSHVLGTQQLPS